MSAPASVKGRPADDRLTIAWAMPTSPRSAIGRDHARVALELARRGHAVTVIATDLEWEDGLARHGAPLPIVHWRDMDLDALRETHDAVAVQWGDNFNFHAGGFEIVARVGALGIFNDFHLHNLFRGWLWWRGSQPGEGLREVVATYGEEAAATMREAQADRLSLQDYADKIPMTEWVGAKCAAAIYHGEFYRGRLARSCPGPLARGNLPVPPRNVPPLPVRRNRGPVLLTVGVMNANKNVERVIAAIGASPMLRETLTYRLVGLIEPEEELRLTVLADRLGFGGLEVYGGLNDAALDEHLAESDMVIALRRPVLEGASGSAVEALLAGRPSIMADAGFYAELPEGAVLKVAADLPVEQITAHLETLTADEALRRRMGSFARTYAEDAFSVERYTDVVEPMLRRAATAARARRVEAVLGADVTDLGLGPDDPVRGRLGAMLSELFGPDVLPQRPSSESGGG